MKNSVIRFIQKTFLLGILCSFALNISCNKKAQNQASDIAQGGQDSGGGNTKGSTSAQVDYYLKNEVEIRRDLQEILNTLVESKDPFFYEPKNSNIIVKFKEEVLNASNNAPKIEDLSILGINMDDNILKNPDAMLEFRKSAERQKKAMKEAKFDSNIALDYQEKFFYGKIGHGFIANDTFKFVAHLKIIYQDLCKDRHLNKKAGSVTEFNKNALICISTEDLAKIPPDSLRKQTHALIIHEISHLLGFYEDDANLIQEFILRNYDQLIKTNNSNYSIRKSLFEKPKQIALILRGITKAFSKEDFLKFELYHEDSNLSNSFNLLYEMNEELKHELQSYKNYLELNARESVLSEAEIMNLVKLLTPFTSELESFCRLYSDLSYNGNEIEHKKYIDHHREFLGREMKKEDYYFIHERINFLANMLEELYSRLNSLSKEQDAVLNAK